MTFSQPITFSLLAKCNKSLFTLFFIGFLALFLTPKVFAEPNSEANQLRQLAQLAEYVGVDYDSAIAKGLIINQGEYDEMLEFSALIVDKTTLIDTSTSAELNKQALLLAQAVKNKMSVAQVRQISAKFRQSLLALMPNTLLPQQLLSKQSTLTLFQDNCASCHGISGQGDGQLAAQLSPQPTNFTDKSRAENRSLIGLFDAISNGLDDTAMPAFNQLKERQRWSLAFYAGSLAFKNNNKSNTLPTTISLQQWIKLSPVQLAIENETLPSNAIEQLRATPQALFKNNKSPMAIAKDQLNLALTANKNGNYKEAQTLAVSAYLDGFELLEKSLDARDKVLRKNIEANLINLRQVINKADQQEKLALLTETIFTQLTQADDLLANSSLSNGALFTASLVILLREGLEALLVIIALITVLIKTGRRETIKYVHIGWIGALIAGFATWAAAQSLISISGASREVMEGVAALIAAIMLLYIGIWMHSKTKADQWQAYIKKHINQQLRSGTLWGLSALSFIAVYREVFETVLFYQSLLTQASPTQYSSTFAGFIVGLILLATLTWAILKYSVKLPIARFFAITTYLLLALSFILMGKAISALQEAAIISISPLPIHIEFDWLGVGSTWQGILAQAVIIIFFTVYIYLSKAKERNHVVQNNG